MGRDDKSFVKKSIFLLLYIAFAAFIFDCCLIFLFEEFNLKNNCFIVSSISNLSSLLITIIILYTIRNKFIVYAMIAIAIGVVGFIFTLFRSVSIIMIVWHGIFAFFTSLVLFQINYSIKLKQNIIKAKEPSVLINLKDELWNTIKINLQIFLSFAAIIGVCMSISFGLNYDELDKKMSAIRMVIGSGVVAGMLYLWVFQTYVKLISELRKKGF